MLPVYDIRLRAWLPDDEPISADLAWLPPRNLDKPVVLPHPFGGYVKARAVVFGDSLPRAAKPKPEPLACADRLVGLSYSHIRTLCPVSLSYAETGSYVQLRYKQGKREEEKEKEKRKRASDARKRGRVSGFSSRSRYRMLTLLNSLPDSWPLPLMIGLTYPSEWPGDWELWKNHQNRIFKAFQRRFPGCMMVWKLEPQQRGAPHFHVFIYTKEDMDLEWLSKTWYRIVASGDEKHLLAGTNCQRAETRAGSLSYASKYLGKEVALMPGWEHVGRYWGVWNRPSDLLEKTWLPQKSAYTIRRIIWKYQASLRKRKHRTPFRGQNQGCSAFLAGRHVKRLLAMVL